MRLKGLTGVWLVLMFLPGCLRGPPAYVPGDAPADAGISDTVARGEPGIDAPVAADATPDAPALAEVWDVPGDQLPVDGWEIDAVLDLDSTVEPDEADVQEEIASDVAPEVVPGPLQAGGAVVCPGVSGEWPQGPFGSSVTWHRNVLVREE